MLQTVEAIIDAQGKLKFTENIRWHSNQRVSVTFLEEQGRPADFAQNYTQVMIKLHYMQAGRKFSRDELNER